MSEIWLPGDSDLALAMRGWPGSPIVKPNVPLKINWNHPLANKLVFYTLYNDTAIGSGANLENGGNLANGIFPFQQGAGLLRRTYTTYGAAAERVSGTVSYAISYNTGWPVGASNLSIAYGIARNGSTLSGQQNFRINSNISLDLVADTTTTATMRYSFTGQWNIVGDTAVESPRDGGRLTAGFTFNGGIGRLYGQGKFLHTKTGSSSIGGSGEYFYLLYSSNDDAKLWAGAWDRTLSDIDMALLHDDPYCFLEPADNSPFLISVPAGGGTPTLSSPGVINVLSDRATPQVTLTF